MMDNIYVVFTQRGKEVVLIGYMLNEELAKEYAEKYNYEYQLVRAINKI